MSGPVGRNIAGHKVAYSQFKSDAYKVGTAQLNQSA